MTTFTHVGAMKLVWMDRLTLLVLGEKSLHRFGIATGWWAWRKAVVARPLIPSR